MVKYNYTQPANELQRFADMVEIPDAEPTENSAQLVTSGGVYDAIQAVEEEAKQLSYNSLMEDTASGSIASFPDGAEGVPVKELTADIEPIQDLHGYSTPWPPAGSKNVLPLSVDGIKAANTSGTWSGNAYTLNDVTFTILTDSADNVIGIRANGTASAETSFVLATNSALQVLAGLSLKLNGSTGGSSSTYCLRAVAWNGTNTSGAFDGDSVTFTPTSAFSYVEVRIFSGVSVSNKDFYPMLRLSTEADATFAPYSNICPIEGWTGAEITRAGKNLVAGSVVYETGSTSYWKLSETTSLKAGSYTASIYNDSANAARLFVNTIVNGVSTTIRNISIAANSRGTTAFTLAEDTVVNLGGRFDPTVNIPDITVFNRPQIELGSSATDYESNADRTTYSVSWAGEAGTVYAGSDEVVNGILSDEALAIVLNGTENDWIASGSLAGRYLLPNRFTNKAIAAAHFMCDTYAVVSVGDSVVGHVFLSDQQQICFNTSYATLAEWKTVLAANNVMVLIGKTPQTYQLTPTEVTTLLGDNNIWSNTGDISVKYRCNTALYIEKKLGA